MASNVTPASIAYVPDDGQEVVIDFDAVMIEDHTTQAQITKFPVQSGMHVSNHSIRNNRVISITAMISNMAMVDKPVDGTRISGVEYGNNATAKVKEIFDALIHSGQVCKVETNLGVYDTVVFSKFKTKQKAGMVDSMELNITGEEIITIDTATNERPTPVTFTTITGAAREALVADLEDMGYSIDDCDKLSQGSFNSDESFIIESVTAAGTAVSTVFEFLGNDPVSRTASYAQSVLGIELFDTGADSATNSPCTAADTSSGLSQIGNCLLSEADDIITEAVEDRIDTALGSLSKGIRGVFYDTVTMDSGVGQALATAGLGCIIRGVTKESGEFPYQPSEALPTATEILSGDLFGTSEKQTLTKIECDCSDQTQPIVDTTTLPIDG